MSDPIVVRAEQVGCRKDEFRESYGESVVVTRKVLQECRAWNLTWAVESLWAPIRYEYELKRVPIWYEYELKRGPIWDDHQRNHSLIRDEYERNTADLIADLLGVPDE